jgi:hypothetical protein
MTTLTVKTARSSHPMFGANELRRASLLPSISSFQRHEIRAGCGTEPAAIPTSAVARPSYTILATSAISADGARQQSSTILPVPPWVYVIGAGSVNSAAGVAITTNSAAAIAASAEVDRDNATRHGAGAVQRQGGGDDDLNNPPQQSASNHDALVLL